jgi:hypothetical protein
MMKKGRKRFLHRGNWLVRAARGVRPDSNPLRRRSDRLEAFVFAASVVVAAVAAPFIVPAVAGASHNAAVSAQATQRATRHEINAFLTQRAADGGGSYAPSSEVLAQASWHADGGIHSGTVSAPAGAIQGSPVTVWVDQQGRLVSAPLDAGQVAGQADLAGAAAAGGLALLLLVEMAIVRRILDRRRMNAWDADWAVSEPQWNRSRW